MPLLYASSAAVYGAGRVFSESRARSPADVYGDRNFCSTKRRAAALTCAARKWWAFVTSTLTARANNTSSKPFRPFHYFPTNTCKTGKVKLFEGYDEHQRRPDAPSLSSVERRGEGQPALSGRPGAPASSTWAAAAPNPSTTSPSPPSTPAANTRVKQRSAWPNWWNKACWNTSTSRTR